MGCLLAIVALAVPRVVMCVAFLTTDWFTRALGWWRAYLFPVQADGDIIGKSLEDLTRQGALSIL